MSSSNTPIAERIALLQAPRRPAAAPCAPDSDDVTRELAQILRSKAFRASPKLQAFLSFLVEETLAGDGRRLTAARIAERVFDKGPGFKSSEDPVIRVASNRLRTALALYSGMEGAKSDVLIDLNPGSYMPVFSFRTAEQAQSPIYGVVQQFDAYLSVSSARSHAAAQRPVLEAMREYPDEAELLAIYAVLAIDAHVHGYGDSLVSADQAWPALEKARSLAPATPLVQFASGFLALTQGDMATVEHCGREMLGSSREDETLAAQGAWLIAMTLDPRDAAEVLRADLLATGDHPGWMHHPGFLSSYQAGDYEGALAEAIAFGMPQFFWGPLERAAALAQLGLRSAAEREIRRAAALNPYLARDPERYLGFYIPQLDALEHVCEGLEKAGLRG